ncbi:RCC1 domain-containing protein/Ank_2 domain-containing protein [Cephalotus follicularis]|uniref:RCC1 domain-containing protein/Ank_2 domain-containing protein n=1 Tax=Cephalotus follicularis TaxID=3775 RepID=A0A1Q3CAM2_CEPFO|nr:RCC1 domain-containing protein/Ank_2 domain-containing protein [Cephalotus follicularis]
METLVSTQGQKQNPQTSRKFLPSGSQKDIWLVVHEGSLADVETALALLKKNGGNVNLRNMFGLTPLHIATWRNHIPIVRRLLAAGADPDARDGESGWSSLHRALHFGHLAVASVLLQSGASVTLEDLKSRTPVDLLSGPVLQTVGSGHDSVATEVFSWGSGANYQLGTGNEHIQKLPCKVDTLHGSFIKLVSAAKFHSVAVSARGEVYTWGFGRGGRLGHPDFDIHSGQAAVITPRQVMGLGARCVKAIAAAKHHTVLATEGGEVFTWGSNREGQLGYTSVDTHPTPRRVNSLRLKIVAVAAANKHTAVVSESGEVFTWGCNREGQLGYGTSNSASNYTPRVVDYLKGKVFIGVAAAKYHTIVLGADGEVYTWGHKLVTPKRVVIARNLKKSGNTLWKFHRMQRLHVVAIAAGMAHSMALTDDGALFYWVSSDPDLRCQELYSLFGKNIESISAGKYWGAAVSSTGDVYMWDGKRGKDKPPVATRLHGVKRSTSVSVGETHLLIIGSLYHPSYPPSVAKNPEKQKLKVRDEQEDSDEEMFFNYMESNNLLSTAPEDDFGHGSIPSLKSLCEKVAAESLVEPRNVLQLLEIADSLGADNLRKHCEDIAIRNLDYILTVSSPAFANASPDILATLEKLLDLRSSEPWSYRRLPTPTATFPVIISSEEEDSESEFLRSRGNHTMKSILNIETDRGSDSFLQPKDDPNQGICKQVRALRKKLQQIEMLEAKRSNGHYLDDQQIAKLQTRSAVESSLENLGFPVDTSGSTDGKENRKSDVSRKHKRKSKQKAAPVETVPTYGRSDIEAKPVKELLEVVISEVSKNKAEDVTFKECVAEAKQTSNEAAFFVQMKDTSDSPKSKSLSPATSKKKNRKGGLSMFLSGALDDTSKNAAAPPPPSPTPRSEGPVWGGAKVSKGSASLREIQDEQSKTKVNQTTRNKDPVEDHLDGRSDKKILLSSLLPSSPIPVASTRTSQVSEGERSTPPWSSGTPPLLSRPSLRDIQMQQGKQQLKTLSLSHSPKTTTAGFSVPNGQGSPSDSPGMNRWFKPEVGTPSLIRSIQIEEKAMKDLKRFYSNVKIVKNQT